MDGSFERDGISFQYPSDWELETEADGGSWTASVNSPGTAFLVVSYVPDVDDPTDLVDAAIEGLQSEYKDLEADDAVGSVAGQPAVGADVRFTHFDLTNTGTVRGVAALDGSLVVLTQCTDEEVDGLGQQLQAIVDSLRIVE